MIIVATVLGLFSAVIFLAHVIEAYLVRSAIEPGLARGNVDIGSDSQDSLAPTPGSLIKRWPFAVSR
jgi:hypothetical protein